MRVRMGLVVLIVVAMLGPAVTHAAVRTLAGDVDAVWRATRSALESDGWSIADEDRSRGRIVTDPRGVSFREFGLYAEGTRHRLLVSVLPAGSGLTSVSVERELYWEERLLWDSVRRPMKPRSEDVEVAVLDSIPLFVPAATVAIVSPATPPPSPDAIPAPAAGTERIPPPAARTAKVTYRVTGNGGPVQVTYRNAQGGNEQQSTASLPWELSFDGHGTTPLYVSAIAQGASHLSVTCEILVDGAPRSQSMSVGSSAIATCRTAAP